MVSFLFTSRGSNRENSLPSLCDRQKKATVPDVQPLGISQAPTLLYPEIWDFQAHLAWNLLQWSILVGKKGHLHADEGDKVCKLDNLQDHEKKKNAQLKQLSCSELKNPENLQINQQFLYRRVSQNWVCQDLVILNSTIWSSGHVTGQWTIPVEEMYSPHFSSNKQQWFPYDSYDHIWLKT